MIASPLEKLGPGLLAHLHLSAAEAAVMVDEGLSVRKLVVFIYDEDAARRTRHITEWAGIPVEYVAGINRPY